MSFACGSCSEVFDDRSPLYFHVVNVHYTLLHFRLAPDRPVLEARRRPSGLFECIPSCGYSSTSPWSLRSHAVQCSLVAAADLDDALPWPSIIGTVTHGGKLSQPGTDTGIDSHGRPRSQSDTALQTLELHPPRLPPPPPPVARSVGHSPQAVTVKRAPLTQAPVKRRVSLPAPVGTPPPVKPALIAAPPPVEASANASSLTYWCYDCDASFEKNLKLTSHRRISHWAVFHFHLGDTIVYEVPRQPDGKFHCARCDMSSFDPYRLGHHVKGCPKLLAAHKAGSIPWATVPGTFQINGMLAQPCAGSRSGNAKRNKEIREAKAREQTLQDVSLPPTSTASATEAPSLKVKQTLSLPRTGGLSEYLADDEDEFSSVGAPSDAADEHKHDGNVFLEASDSKPVIPLPVQTGGVPAIKTEPDADHAALSDSSDSAIVPKPPLSDIRSLKRKFEAEVRSASSTHNTATAASRDPGGWTLQEWRSDATQPRPPVVARSTSRFSASATANAAPSTSTPAAPQSSDRSRPTLSAATLSPPAPAQTSGPALSSVGSIYSSTRPAPLLSPRASHSGSTTRQTDAAGGPSAPSVASSRAEDDYKRSRIEHATSRRTSYRDDDYDNRRCYGPPTHDRLPDYLNRGERDNRRSTTWASRDQYDLRRSMPAYPYDRHDRDHLRSLDPRPPPVSDGWTRRHFYSPSTRVVRRYDPAWYHDWSPPS